MNTIRTLLLPPQNASKQFQPVDIDHHDVSMSRVEERQTRIEVYNDQGKNKIRPETTKEDYYRICNVD